MFSVNDFYAADRQALVKLVKLAMGLGIRVGGDARFMVEPRYLSTIAQLVKGERVLEVGFGLCFLTNYLTRYAQWVSACDISLSMLRVVRAMRLTPIDADLFICDALTYTPPLSLTVVSNMPYSITTPLLLRMLTGYGARRLVLTLQREVAMRLTARPGSRDYGRLSVITQCLSNVRVVGTVPPWAFWPSPKVYSAIVELTPLPQPCTDIAALESLTGKVFTQPNKRVIKVLRHFYGLSERNVPRDLMGKRVRDLSISDIVELIKILNDAGKLNLTPK